jgi:hypothetical protein
MLLLPSSTIENRHDGGDNVNGDDDDDDKDNNDDSCKIFGNGNH